MGTAMESASTSGFLSDVTMLPVKVGEYSAEGVLGSFWEPRLTHLPAASVRQVAQHVTALVLRPELAMMRQAAACLRWLRSRRYTIVFTGEVRVDRVCEALWRFQWNAVNPGTLHLVRLLYRTAPCLLLVLRHDACGGLPAAIKLSAAKGAAEPDERSGVSLRDTLAGPSKILAMVHAPDEPIDVLRDLALLADGDARLAERLTRAVTGQPMHAPERAVFAWQDSIKRRVFDSRPILAALAARVRSTPDSARAEVWPLLAAMQAGRKVEWLGFLAALDKAGVRLDTDDEIVLGGLLAQTRTPGPPKLIGPPDYRQWRAWAASKRNGCCHVV
jgi:hypothetical protein